MKADEIASETAKTGKVTAVVAVMSILRKKMQIVLALILEMKGLLAKRLKGPIFQRKIPTD